MAENLDVLHELGRLADQNEQLSKQNEFLSNQMAELMSMMEGLMKQRNEDSEDSEPSDFSTPKKTASTAKTTPKTASTAKTTPKTKKTPAKKTGEMFEGFIDDIEDKIVGKVLVQGYVLPHVVYESAQKKKYYFSPEKASNIMTRRYCSQSQVLKMSKLTDEDAYNLEMI